MLRKKLRLSASLAAGLLATSLMAVTTVNASDHQEAPLTAANPAADIGDYYAWHDGDNINLVLTFGTFAPAGSPASYTDNTLFAMHFDNNGDNVSDVDLYARFAQDEQGAWGVQVMGDGIETIQGAVETNLAGGGAQVWAGNADDPFFFDLAGFNETVATGTIAFTKADAVAGLNITALVVQIPNTVTGPAFQTWATSNIK